MVTRRGLVAMVGLAPVVAATGACGSSDASELTPARGTIPTLDVEPAADASGVDLDGAVKISVADGTLADVSVTTEDGDELDGEFNEDRTEWRSTTAFVPAATYAIAATADGTGGQAEFDGAFTTAEADQQTLAVSDVTPYVEGEKVGVGAPIIVTFNESVADQAAVEAALEVTSEKDHEGAWRWLSDQQVIYRTAEYWEAHQKVTFRARLKNLRIAEGVYGAEDHKVVIEIGAAQISVVDAQAHTMTVEVDGENKRNMKISAGNATTTEYTTASGIHLTMEGGNPVRMTAPGREEGDEGWYDMDVDFAVRINATGEYVHSAPWSVADQGVRNVSHGCVNCHPDDAEWFYNMYQRGDIVDVVGTDRELPWDNGWSYWQLSFDEWKEGSAL